MEIAWLYIKATVSALLNAGVFYLAFVRWKDDLVLSTVFFLFALSFCWLGHVLAEYAKLYDSAMKKEVKAND